MSLDHIIPSLHPLAVPIGRLKPDPKNARLHDERNIEAVRASLARFKQRKNIVARADGTVIAGNGTLEVAGILGWSHIAVAFVDDDDPTAAAYAIADNRSAELAEWDYLILSAQLEGIKEEDLRRAVGFTEEEIGALNWDSDIDDAKAAVAATEANLDGIPEEVVVRAPKELAPEVRKEINSLIRSRGVVWEKVVLA